VVRFGVHVRNDNRERTPPLVRLKAVCGPGDRGEPDVTVMLPDQDGPLHGTGERHLPISSPLNRSKTLFGIGKLVSAVRTLAENALALAATLRDINGGLRQRLALDEPEEAPEALDHAANDPAAGAEPEARPGEARGLSPETMRWAAGGLRAAANFGPASGSRRTSTPPSPDAPTRPATRSKAMLPAQA
jgi:hypothetical protein